MSSLASTAALWTNEDAAKKKTPSMNRKTVKAKPQQSHSDFTSASIEEYTIFDTKEAQQQTDERTNKVTEIINQMSAVNIENDGSKLADFTPPPNPAVQQKKPIDLGVPFQKHGSNDGKLMEKINYMIHMLENMESEKTANVTEEFVLYSFTGIFIIFVLDSFLKTGKYVR